MYRRDRANGQRGIRTLDTLSRIHAFQACAFNRSATCPSSSCFRDLEMPRFHRTRTTKPPSIRDGGSKKADRERFELSIPLRVRQFSRLVHSTALPPVQYRGGEPPIQQPWKIALGVTPVNKIARRARLEREGHRSGWRGPGNRRPSQGDHVRQPGSGCPTTCCGTKATYPDRSAVQVRTRRTAFPSGSAALTDCATWR